MAARKTTTRKKAAAKKTAKKAAKKSTRKSAKKATRKKAGRKKASRSLGARTRKAIDDNLRELERELPKHLKTMIRDIRKGVSELENQIEKARADGEARWADLEKQVRNDSEKMLKRFGLGKSKKKSASSKKTSRRKTASKKRARR